MGRFWSSALYFPQLQEGEANISASMAVDGARGSVGGHCGCWRATPRAQSSAWVSCLITNDFRKAEE